MAPRALAGGGLWTAQELQGEGLSPAQLATRSDTQRFVRDPSAHSTHWSSPAHVAPQTLSDPERGLAGGARPITPVAASLPGVCLSMGTLVCQVTH